MNKLVLINFITLLSLSFSVQAIDLDNGKTLHDENCTRCHDSSKYTREDRIVNSFEELKTRIRDCELMAEAAWFDEEIDDVTAYLNEVYYRFNLEK